MDSKERIFNENLDQYNWNDNNGNSIAKQNFNEYLAKKNKKTIQESIMKYMPIGSVLKIKNQIGMYMIVGYKCQNNNVEFDYISVKYPGGITNNSQFIPFNHDQIEKIFHIGMISEIQKEYKESLLGESEGFNKTL